MKTSLWEKFDNAIRHRAALGRHLWLRELLRQPYHALLRLNRRGYSLRLGGCIEVRVPPEFASKLMETHEMEEFREIKRWCEVVDDGWFIDVGCSIGYMSCAALFSNQRIKVLAMDSDANSLQSVGRICHYAGLDRLDRIQALIMDTSSGAGDLTDLIRQTKSNLQNPHITGDPGTHAYVNLDHPAAPALAKASLDDLLRAIVAEQRPMLIKCDIEGAEYVALLGAERVMRHAKPVLLLSVHPEKLKAFGSSRDQVARLLEERDYHYDVIAIDHEEHWLCTSHVE